jgi:ABC-2 type transport system permease protein
MNKLLQVALFEYRRNVFKKGFLLAILSVPFFIIFIIGMGFCTETFKDNPLPVGYIDESGILSAAIPAPEVKSRWFSDKDESIGFIVYPTEEEARQALEAKDIQAYYMIPLDYVITRHVRLVYAKKPGENAMQQFYNFLQINLLSSQAPEIAHRAAAGTDAIVRSLDGRRTIPQGPPTINLLMPLFISMAFLFLLMLSSGYIMGAVAEEKENRTIEILITTISPMQLIGGKVAGIVCVSFTLLMAWTLTVILSLFIASQAGIIWLQDIKMDWGVVLSTVAIAIPAYVLASALMTALGAILAANQEGQAVSTIFFMLHWIPAYLISLGYLNSPNDVLPVIFSILPFSSLMTFGMRNLLTIVPTWQIVASASVQTLCALGAIWFAGRAFRSGMLRYGKKVSWPRLFRIRYERAG